jgi:serine/threonine protein phosphatase 1
MNDIQRVVVEGPAAVIGDIHGRFDLLKKLLAKLGKRMPVFFVGDLIDRGPQSFEVVECLMARGARGVRGNHEEWMQRWCRGDGFQPDVLHRAFGGAATLASYGLDPAGPWGPRFVEIPPAHRRFFLGLPLVIDLEVSGQRYWIIHAGVHRTTALEPGLTASTVMPWLVENEPWDLTWVGGDIETCRDLGRPVIYGHSPRLRPQATKRAIAIDTGCGTWESGALSAVVLPEQRFVSVAA